MFSGSADQSVCVWDAQTGERIKRYRYAHNNIINSICAAPKHTGFQGQVCSGSDDGQVLVWDTRQKEAVYSFQQDFQVTAVEYSKDGSMIFAGGLDEMIHCWDIRTGNELYKLAGHSEAISGMRLSPDGNHLVSNSMDNSGK